jgi:sulfur transfer protein SufE
MSYFENLTSLLQIEREEDRNQYKQLTESTSVSERRANGLRGILWQFEVQS